MNDAIRNFGKLKGENMEKFKNFCYNTSDIMVALIIVLISLIIIGIKTNNIMNFPSYLEETQTKIEKPNKNFGLAVPVDDGKIKGNKTNADSKSDKKSGTYAVYINYGEDLNTIADKFVEVGLFDSRKEFIEIATQMGATESIKSGNFVMPASSSKKEVISRIITNP